MRVLVLTALLLTASSVVDASQGSSVLGSQLKLDLRRGGQLSGELLSVEDDSLQLLSSRGETLVVRLGEITRARVPRRGLSSKRVLVWTAIGGLVSGALLTGACTSVSNDCAGVFPAVMLSWAVFGGASAAIAGSSWRTVDADAQSLTPYARFPQGLPAEFVGGASDAGVSYAQRLPRPYHEYLAVPPLATQSNWGRVRAEYR